MTLHVHAHTGEHTPALHDESHHHNLLRYAWSMFTHGHNLIREPRNHELLTRGGAADCYATRWHVAFVVEGPSLLLVAFKTVIQHLFIAASLSAKGPQRHRARALTSAARRRSQ